MKFKGKMNIKVILQKTGAKLPKGTKKKKTKKQKNKITPNILEGDTLVLSNLFQPLS